MGVDMVKVTTKRGCNRWVAPGLPSGGSVRVTHGSLSPAADIGASGCFHCSACERPTRAICAYAEVYVITSGSVSRQVSIPSADCSGITGCEATTAIHSVQVSTCNLSNTAQHIRHPIGGRYNKP